MKKNDFFLVTKKEGIKYSLLSRDNNKIHVDPSYGYNSLFGQNICHGTFIILNFLKKIKFHDKQNFYMDISFRYPFFYNHKIFIKKKNKSQTQYSLLQGKKEKALISLDFSNETGIETVKWDVSDYDQSSAEIKKHENKKGFLEVSVSFVSEIISCVKDKDNKILSGDPKKIKKVFDTWTFSKEVNSKNPNWLLVSTEA